MSSRPLLFVDHAPALGGAELSLLCLLGRLDRGRWAPQLISPGGPLAEEARALGLPVHVLPLERLRRSSRAPLAWLAGARAIARVAREAEAALLIANTVRAALYTAPAARLAGVPFVWHMRDYWLSEAAPAHPWLDRLGKRLLAAGATRVIANSRSVAAQLPHADRVAVVYNGIEVERYDPALPGGPFRARHGLPPAGPLVGMVGRLRPWKGQERFLRAMARVAESLPEARFAVVGGAILGPDDGYPARLQRLAGELGLGERVIFTGHLADVRPALAAMDLLVHPGDPEPFGRVVVEAMAMARPVVACAHGALPEIVLPGETGLLVPPGDEAALAAAVLALLHDPEQRQRMGQAGRARVERCFSVERMVSEMESVLAGALARK